MSTDCKHKWNKSSTKEGMIKDMDFVRFINERIFHKQATHHLTILWCDECGDEQIYNEDGQSTYSLPPTGY